MGYTHFLIKGGRALPPQTNIRFIAFILWFASTFDRPVVPFSFFLCTAFACFL